MQKEKFSSLHQQIHRTFRASAENFLSFDAQRHIAWGYGTRRAGDRYHWDGQKRGASSGQMRVLFQYTVRGRGEYAEGNNVWSLESGDGFTALLPSAHRYYLPDDSDEWTFFWFIVTHPFVTDRIREFRRQEAAVQKWPPGSPALELAVALIQAANLGQLREIWDFEERLFPWLLETERELQHRRYPRDDRQQLLSETRSIVQERLQNPPNAGELAGMHAQERTTFSRKFKATTGLSPAAFVTEVRLEEALKLLRTPAKMEEIAGRTGFADANHFCKVFRRHFHSSPGAYRKLFLK